VCLVGSEATAGCVASSDHTFVTCAMLRSAVSRDLALRSSAPRVDSSHASGRAAASGWHVLASPPGCGASSSCCRSLVAVGSLVAVLVLPFALSILLPFAPARHSTPRISGAPHANSLPACNSLPLGRACVSRPRAAGVAAVGAPKLSSFRSPRLHGASCPHPLHMERTRKRCRRAGGR
jgi:hypothetical protein